VSVDLPRIAALVDGFYQREADYRAPWHPSAELARVVERLPAGGAESERDE
jgi:hypothetical protein